MLAQADFERALALALGELAPEWTIVGDCAPVDPFDPGHWGSGSRSFQATLRHQVTGHLKVLGRRVADEPGASLHPAVALSVIGAYRHGNIEPLRRYLEEIGVAPIAAGEAPAIFRRAAPAPAAVAASGAPIAVVAAHDAAPHDVAPADRSAQSPAVDSRGRVLGRLRRELAIWQWRRSAGVADLGISRTRE